MKSATRSVAVIERLPTASGTLADELVALDLDDPHAGEVTRREGARSRGPPPGRRAAFERFCIHEGQPLDDWAAWCALAEIHDVTTDAAGLARATGRAHRSAIGTWTFAAGGFVLEGGRRQGHDDVAPLLARLPFPHQWRCVVAVPAAASGQLVVGGPVLIGGDLPVAYVSASRQNVGAATPVYVAGPRGPQAALTEALMVAGYVPLETPEFPVTLGVAADDDASEAVAQMDAGASLPGEEAGGGGLVAFA